MLENDLLLTRFLDRYENELSDVEQAALYELLELPDQQLLSLLLDNVTSNDGIDITITPVMNQLLAKIRHS